MLPPPPLEFTKNLIAEKFGDREHGYDHMERVAAQVQDEDMATIHTAWLHDIIEDTKMTLDDLRVLYPPEVVIAVDLLTHDKKALTYPEYIDRICESGNRRAIYVKLADLEDNTDPMRMLRLNPYAIRALQKRYHGVKLKLMAAAIRLNPNPNSNP